MSGDVFHVIWLINRQIIHIYYLHIMSVSQAVIIVSYVQKKKKKKLSGNNLFRKKELGLMV